MSTFGSHAASENETFHLLVTIARRSRLWRGKVKNKTLLDIGTGPLATIAARDFNCQVTSIDVSKEAQKEAERAGLAQEINFEKEDANNLSYQDGAFDVMISYGALHHNPPGKRRKLIEKHIE